MILLVPISDLNAKKKPFKITSLAVSSIGQGNLYAGERVRVRCTWVNDQKIPIKAALYIDNKLVKRREIDVFSAKSWDMVEHYWNALPGEHRFACKIRSTDRRRVKLSKQISKVIPARWPKAAAPDLYVKNVSYKYLSEKRNGKSLVEMSISIGNKGTATFNGKKKVNVDFIASHYYTKEKRADNKSYSIPPLKKGEIKTFKMKIPHMIGPSWYVKITVDKSKLIKELDESNNVWSKTLTFVDKRPIYPDLVVKDFKYAYLSKKVNGKKLVQASAMIKNIGKANYDGKTKLKVDVTVTPKTGKSLIPSSIKGNRTLALPLLRPGAGKWVPIEMPHIPAGTYRVSVWADSRKAVYELNEQNNTLFRDVTFREGNPRPKRPKRTR